MGTSLEPANDCGTGCSVYSTLRICSIRHKRLATEYAIGAVPALSEEHTNLKTEVFAMKPVVCKFLLSVVLVVPVGGLVESAWAQSARLDWLSGDWCMTSGNQTVEETWLPEVGGNLLGMSRTVEDGKVVTFEFLRIGLENGTTQYIAQPGGGAATIFTASQVSENHLVVENLENDFPQKITYQREAEALTATISGPGDGGREMSISFNYQACQH